MCLKFVHNTLDSSLLRIILLISLDIKSIANGSVFCVALKSNIYSSASSIPAMMVENVKEVCNSSELGTGIVIDFFMYSVPVWCTGLTLEFSGRRRRSAGMTGYASCASAFKFVRQRIQQPQLCALTGFALQLIDMMTNQIELVLAADRAALLNLGKAFSVLDEEVREMS